MAAIEEYISQIQDEGLRRKISDEVRKLKNKKKFGLVFEEHLPECTPLYDIPVKRGSKVALKSGKVNEFYRVMRINGETAICIKKGETEPVEFPLAELVSVAEFGEAIYPCLKPVDTVCNAPDDDLWHTLIEADNYHALQLLRYLYAGKVDCIYIDPPYNTGAKDWKYNNDYVDGVDEFRHSKWLSMMKKRLEIAQDLLNPRDSVLIITIDEKEYHHLACLLEEMFSYAKIQMVSSVISPAGVSDPTMFNKTNEFIFYIYIGEATIIHPHKDCKESEVDWWYLHRRDYASRRGAPKGGTAQFYPIYVNDKTQSIIKIGTPIPPGVDRFSVPQIDGCSAVFPVRKDGTEMNWGLTPDSLQQLFDEGAVRVSKGNSQQKYIFRYLSASYKEKIEEGTWRITGRRADGSLVVVSTEGKLSRISTVWNNKTHVAKEYGTGILSSLIGNGRFTYPKSLYAVEDCLKYYIAEKKNALVIDFFSGSGTTLHAVNLLNAEDGGHRRCIMVTNNEVSDDEAKTLTQQGYHPGDEEWERLGIARYVTWPRTVCSIEGHDVNGNPLKGNYIGSDLPMADGFKANAAYFKLGFLDKNEVALGTQFKEMLPTLWMKSGAHGPCPSVVDDTLDMLVLPENRFAVLIDERKYMEFVGAVDEHPEIETVFIVTDSEIGYRDMIAAFEEKNTYQLYRDYLDNFRINVARR